MEVRYCNVYTKILKKISKKWLSCKKKKKIQNKKIRG